MSGSAAIDTPHTKRYWAAAQRKTPRTIGPHTYTYTYRYMLFWHLLSLIHMKLNK